MLDQRRRRWGDVVKLLCKCFVFAGNPFNAGTLFEHLSIAFVLKNIDRNFEDQN